MPDTLQTGTLLTVDAPVVPAQAQAPAPSITQWVVFFVAMIGIMYVLVYLPQQREKKAHEELLASLAKDDRVVTTSGLHGKVASVGDATLQLEIADKTRITIDKSAVARKVDTAGAKKE